MGRFFSRLFAADSAYSVADKLWLLFSLAFPTAAAAVTGWLASESAAFWSRFGFLGVAVMVLSTFFVVSASLALLADFFRWKSGHAPGGQKRELRTSEGTATRTKAEYVTKQTLGTSFGLNSGTEPAIVYRAAGAAMVDRLRIYLDVANMMILGGIIRSHRIKIAEVSDLVRGKVFTTTLMMRNMVGGDYTYIWNSSDSNVPEFTITKRLARVVLIGDSGEEQHYYFMIVPAVGYSAPFFEVLAEEQLAFPQQWEAQKD